MCITFKHILYLILISLSYRLTAQPLGFSKTTSVMIKSFYSNGKKIDLSASNFRFAPSTGHDKLFYSGIEKVYFGCDTHYVFQFDSEVEHKPSFFIINEADTMQISIIKEWQGKYRFEDTLCFYPKKHCEYYCNGNTTLCNDNEFSKYWTLTLAGVSSYKDSILNSENYMTATRFKHTDYTYHEHKWNEKTLELFCGKIKNNEPWDGVFIIYNIQKGVIVNSNFSKPIKNGVIFSKKYIKPS